MFRVGGVELVFVFVEAFAVFIGHLVFQDVFDVVVYFPLGAVTVAPSRIISAVPPFQM